jgi:hypothetical protein
MTELEVGRKRCVIELSRVLCVNWSINQRESCPIARFGGKGGAGKMGITMPETTWLRGAIVGLGLVVALAGCAAIERHDAEQTEQMLAAAGFQMRPADTQAKLADLERLQQHQLVRHERDGETTYVYADAADCQCLYTGDQANYDQFQKLQVQEDVAQQEMMAAEMNQQAAMNWEMWGPW